MPVSMQRLKQAKDAQLIRLFQLGNNLAFSIIVLRYEPELKKYIHTLLHNAFNEKDLLQNFWLVVIKLLRQHHYKENGHFLQWLRTLAYRMAVSLKRRKKPIANIDEITAPAYTESHPADDDMPDKRYLQIKEALIKLNKNYREVIKLRIEDDLPFKEIALQTHSDIHTITSRFSKAIKKLRRLLKRKQK